MTGENAKDQAPRVTIDDMAQDLFGLNVRGLKSISVLIIAPYRYFEAAMKQDWMGRYTPSIRLWLSLLAVFSLLKTFFVGTDTPLIVAFAEGFREAGVIPAEGQTYASLAEAAIWWMFAMGPILQFACLLLLALVFPFWGQKSTFGLRQRLLFGIMVPSSTMGLVLVAGMKFVPMEWLTVYALGMAVCSFIIDMTTGVRGPLRNKGGWGRIWRSGLLALIIAMINVGTSVIAQIAAIVIVSQRMAVPMG